MVRLPRNETQIHLLDGGLKFGHEFDLIHDPDLEFSRSNIKFVISELDGPIAMKRKTNISNKYWAWNVALQFGHGFGLEF